MIFTVASALTYVNRRNLVDIFPSHVKKVWQEWELRVLILLSLTMQIVLILFGKRRKYIARTWIKFILWSAYLLADWFATVSLGVISSTSLEDCAGKDCCPSRIKGEPDRELMSFWAPFLLLHLGGPDTITAYSLEDNELWLRHLLGLAVQMGVAMYICLMALPGKTCLPILSIPIFEAGLIKYVERTWALRSASIEHLRESMLTDPDAGPNYAKFMEEFTLKKAEGFQVEAAGVLEASDCHDPPPPPSSEHELVVKAYDLFHTFKRLFVDLILSFQDRETSQTFFQKLSHEKAFHVIEVELGFAFDVFYTKAPVMYTLGGCMLRLASFCSVVGVLIAFVFFCDNHKPRYHKIDLIITYLLLVVAVLLEIYAVILMLRSDWTDYLLSKHSKTRDFLVVPCLKHPEKQWWSNSMAQHNLISFCLEHKPPKCLGIQRLLQVNKLREKHCYKTFKTVPLGLKELIFNCFLDFIASSEDPQALCAERGSFVCQKDNFTSSLELTIKNVEFDKSLLIWHIATDLCYYWDDGDQNIANVDSGCNEACKLMSDYMLYLLVMCPSLLPMGIGMIRFRDTCAETWEFFEEMNLKTGKARVFCGEMSPKVGKAEACEKLRQVNTEVNPLIVKGDRSKSVLFEGCRLAKSLRGIENRWEIMSLVWVEMLAYAATHCGGHQHAQQLRKGGELLTHVWLLMAHLGITEQFQIKKGHARAKLIVK